MTGNPIKKAENSGTVPLENQMKANKITDITGVALKSTKKGTRKACTRLEYPAKIPKKLPTIKIKRKLRKARPIVVIIFNENGFCCTRETNADNVVPGVGRMTAASNQTAPTCHITKRIMTDRAVMSLVVQVERRIGHRTAY